MSEISQFGTPCVVCGRTDGWPGTVCSVKCEIKNLESELSKAREQVERYREALECAKRALKSANSFERTEPIDMVLDCIIDDISEALNPEGAGEA